MSILTFRPNSSLSLGVEIELQLVDQGTGDLKPVAPLILESQIREGSQTRLKSELFQSMIEIDTPICSNAFEASRSLRSSLAHARDRARAFGADVIMSGTHPFARYTERLLTPSGRYYSLVDRNQWITRRLQIFGLHVHIGMRSGEHAIAMNNAFCHYLPLLLALSASSPYWQNEDTGLASSRITFFEALPTGGHPYLLNDWGDFENLINKLLRSGSITGIKDLWWDIRPNTEFGTIEIRVMDCPPTMKEVEALVALVHSLAIFIDAELTTGRRFTPPPEWILRENKWRASRHGVSCDVVMNDDGTSAPFLEVWSQLLKSLQPTIASQRYEGFFEFLCCIVEKGPSYIRQRRHNPCEPASIVQHLIQEGINDHPEWGSL